VNTATQATTRTKRTFTMYALSAVGRSMFPDPFAAIDVAIKRPVWLGLLHVICLMTWKIRMISAH
jgi:hypothetical protein